MLTYENLVGNQEDWAEYVTNVEMRETPFLEWLPKGKKPVNVIRSYQADKFAVPRKNSHVDGKPWTAFNSAGDGRGQLKALIQWFDNTTSVSKLAQDVTNPAAIMDELAHDIPKRLKEMSTDMEVNFLEDWDCREDNKVDGYLTRGVGSWISSAAQALYPVPTAFLTPAASINSGNAVATATENDIRLVLGSIWNTIKSKELMTGFLGLTLKQKFSDFQFYTPSSASTQSTGVTFEQDGTKRAILRAVDRYESDAGPMDLILTPWLAAITGAGSTTISQGRGYFLHKSKWEMAWQQKPKVYRPEFKGGSYEAAMDCIAMLCCLNPMGEGKFAPG